MPAQCPFDFMNYSNRYISPFTKLSSIHPEPIYRNNSNNNNSSNSNTNNYTSKRQLVRKTKIKKRKRNNINST